jgi:ferredoxin/flavodoxin---NADP+ reductase
VAQASFTTPELDPAGRTAVEEDRTARANLKILHEYAARDRHDAQRRIVLRFLSSPAELVGRRGRITGLRVERNELVVDAYGGLRSKGMGQFDLIETGLVVRSIGYRTVPIEGVPFDPATSTVSNIAGQAVHPSTVEVMVADLPDLKGVRDDHRDRSRIEAVLRRRGIDYTTYQGWRVLDGHELALGASQGRPRVKVCSVPEMLEVIHRGP